MEEHVHGGTHELLPMLMGRKNQYRGNGQTAQDNLQIQCHPQLKSFRKK